MENKLSQFDHLTRKQREVLDYLLAHQDRFRHPPTLEELCSAMGLKSRGSLHKHIQGLIEAGLVAAPHRKQRGVRLTEQALSGDGETNGLPLVGAIAAGHPLEAIENVSYIPVPDQLRTDKCCYVLLVKGDSMTEAGILDGDWVVIEQRSQARDGEIVVALIDQNEATLKFIRQLPHEVQLIPANSAMQTMCFHPSRVEIQGVLVGQMRSYQ